MSCAVSGPAIVLAVVVGSAALAIDLGAQPPPPTAPTFTRDVAPIVYAHCAGCHRPNQMAPMSLLSYEETRPWARAIRQRVVDRQMPPWFADPAHGRFRNDASLSTQEIDTIARWVDAGAPRGDDRDLPAPPRFSEHWTIGEPDVVLAIPPYEVPASGVIPYLYFSAPTTFTEDTWIDAMEIQPGDRRVVHHVIVSVAEPGRPVPEQGATRSGADVLRGQLGGITPNRPGVVFPHGTGKLIKAGSTLVFQMHYTAIGEAVTDRTRIGLRIAKTPPARQLLSGMAINPRFVIPPGADNHEVRAVATVNEDIQLISMTPHMHFRGKSFTFTAVFEDGRRETLLHVPSYDFNWQLSYVLEQPLALPKGTRIEAVAHFDNSTRNRFNPDPTAEVRWGDQTWEEMMIGFYGYTRDAEGRTTSAAGR